MIHDLIFACYKGEYKIEVRFNDGREGMVDFSQYLHKGAVFDPSKDIDFFKQFKVNENLGTLTWQDEIDTAPETFYAEATGTPFPNWMQSKKRTLNKIMQRINHKSASR